MPTPLQDSAAAVVNATAHIVFLCNPFILLEKGYAATWVKEYWTFNGIWFSVS